MKYGQIIKPEDVPRLCRSGELRFGTELEFSNCFNYNAYPVVVGKLNGFWNAPTRQFYCESDTFDGSGWYSMARIPLPALKAGDPVVLGDVEHKRFFSHFNEDGINCYKDGQSAWTCKSTSAWGDNWRLPTKKELHDAGLDGWYDGRIELEEG